MIFRKKKLVGWINHRALIALDREEKPISVRVSKIKSPEFNKPIYSHRKEGS